MSGGESRAAEVTYPHHRFSQHSKEAHHETHYFEDPEAEKVVRRLRFKTGLPIRQIVSEIIVQAENLIDISGDDDEDETDQ